MSSTTSVPSIVFGPNGPVAPQQSALVAGLVADYTAAFGGNLNTAPGTPAGQLIASTAAMLGGSQEQIINALSNARADGGALRTYRHAPNTGSRKSWAAGDATSRGVRHALEVVAVAVIDLRSGQSVAVGERVRQRDPQRRALLLPA